MGRWVLVGLLTMFAAGAAAARSDAPILERHGYIHVFAADGARVALPAPQGDCDSAEAVDVVKRETVSLATPGAICMNEFSGTESWEIAVAGDRVAWLEHGMTNNSSALVLSTARVGSQRSRIVASGDGPTFSGDEIERPDRRIGLLAGDGATLSFATWTIAVSGKTVVNERLWRIGPTGAPLPLGSAPGVAAIAVEHGTVAALQRSGRVMLIDTRTGVRRTVVLQGLGVRSPRRRDADLGLHRRRLVVLTATSLEAYDRASGSRVAFWPLPRVDGRVRGLVDVEGDWITYLVRNRIHVHRISDGAAGVVAPSRVQPARCDGDVWVQVEPVGLLYTASRVSAKRGCAVSRLDVIPFDELAGYVNIAGG